MGRLTSVWLPGRTQGEDTPDLQYEYWIGQDDGDVEGVRTTTLSANGDPVSSVELYDALLRPRQTQSLTAAREASGRLVSETLYDSRGLAVAQQGPWYTSGEPGRQIVTPTVAAPSRTRVTYDGAGRVTREAFEVDNSEQPRS